MDLELLQVVSSERDARVVEQLKSTGMGIVERCGGSPLAIKAIAGLLSHKDINNFEWEKVLRSPSWSIIGMPEEVNHAIYLSYEDLHPALKQCLLYCSLFPAKFEPLSSRLIAMWISEGFVHANSNELEELGKEYYEELKLRNLIEPKSKSSQYQWIMHDVVRSFAQHIAKDEALVLPNSWRHVLSDDLDSHKIRRLSVRRNLRKSEEDISNWSALPENESLRTLILLNLIKLKTGDLWNKFPNLRILHIRGGRFPSSIDSLCQLKHLRYLHFEEANICCLPDDLSKIKFLEHIGLRKCEQTVQLPGSMTKLAQLRCFTIVRTKIDSVPRGFGSLTNLRSLVWFPAHMGSTPTNAEDWCSLEELGPLSQLRELRVEFLENVSSSSFSAKAMLSDKKHLTSLSLRCSNKLGDDDLINEDQCISDEEQRRIEEVFDELCPPPSLDNLVIEKYFGQRLPKWMMSTATVTLQSLTTLKLHSLACCTKLPDGLCQLPCLQVLAVLRAPGIKRIGPEFLHLNHNSHGQLSQPAVAFPRLDRLHLIRMVEWEEWVWEEQLPAMPILEELQITSCKLGHVPVGLASHARSLKIFKLVKVKHLKYLENLSSVVELHVCESPDMERITNLPKLRKLFIVHSPKMKVLEGIPAIQNLQLINYVMKTLPDYLQNVKPSRLVLNCSLALLSDISMGESGSELNRISHIDNTNAYANDKDKRSRWYVFYTRDPLKLQTNIICSSVSRGKK